MKLVVSRMSRSRSQTSSAVVMWMASKCGASSGMETEGAVSVRASMPESCRRPGAETRVVVIGDGDIEDEGVVADRRDASLGCYGVADPVFLFSVADEAIHAHE